VQLPIPPSSAGFRQFSRSHTHYNPSKCRNGNRTGLEKGGGKTANRGRQRARGGAGVGQKSQHGSQTADATEAPDQFSSRKCSYRFKAIRARCAKGQFPQSDQAQRQQKTGSKSQSMASASLPLRLVSPPSDQRTEVRIPDQKSFAIPMNCREATGTKCLPKPVRRRMALDPLPLSLPREIGKLWTRHFS
jgi:hypothetical protein